LISTAYADSSFFVSLYLADVHSRAAGELLSSGTRVWFTPLHYAECTHAIVQQVFFHNLQAAEAQKVYAALVSDQSADLWLRAEIPVSAFEVCSDLARRYGPRLGVRTLDSLHVACALELNAERFWTFDERQAKLAKAVGLKG
jgi:predicted nucleic acid-binding protein